MLFENVARHMFCQEYILLVRVFRSSAADGDGILHIEEPAVIQVFYGTLPNGLSSSNLPSAGHASLICFDVCIGK